MKLNGETIKEGVVIAKRKQPGIFKTKYVICVRFDDAFNKKTRENKVEYKVDANRYYDIIIGARVQGAFAHALDGFHPVGYFF